MPPPRIDHGPRRRRRRRHGRSLQAPDRRGPAAHAALRDAADAARSPPAALRQGADQRTTRIIGSPCGRIKIGADGALGSRGAALLEPYSDEPGTTGLLTTPPDDVYAQTLAASKAGFQTCIHAIGDRGNRMTMDVFERVQKEVPTAKALRMRNEHSQILDAARDPALQGARRDRLDPADALHVRHAVGAHAHRRRAHGGRRVRVAQVDRRGRAHRQRIGLPRRGTEPDARVLRGHHASGRRRPAARRLGAGSAPDARGDVALVHRSTPPTPRTPRTQTGSLAAGKLADVVMLSHDIMTIPPPEILKTTVLEDDQRRRGRLRSCAMMPKRTGVPMPATLVAGARDS